MNNNFIFLYNDIDTVYNATKEALKKFGNIKDLSENINNHEIKGTVSNLFGSNDEVYIKVEKFSENKTKLFFKTSNIVSQFEKNKTFEKFKVILDTLLPEPIMDELPNSNVVNVPNTQEVHNFEYQNNNEITSKEPDSKSNDSRPDPIMDFFKNN